MNVKKPESLDWFFTDGTPEEITEWQEYNKAWKMALVAKGPLPLGIKPYRPETALQGSFHSGESNQPAKTIGGQQAKWERNK